MTHLEEMSALADRIQALALGVKRKGNPDYVLDPVSKRYKLKEPKAKKPGKPARKIPAGWDEEKVERVTATLRELFPNPDSTIPARVADPEFPRLHRTRLTWAHVAHLLESTEGGLRLKLSPAGRDFLG